MQSSSTDKGIDFAIRRIIDLLPTMAAYIDRDLTCKYVSSRFAEALQVDPSSVTGGSLQELLGDESFSKLLIYFNKALAGEKCRVLTSISGHQFAKDFEISLIPDGNAPDGFVMQLKEASARNLREKYFRDHMESASVGLHWVNKHGIIIWANNAELDLLGYKKSEYIGQHISQFHADKQAIQEILNKLENGETIISREVCLIHKDGSLRTVLLSSNVLWDNDKFIHTRCFTVDITGQKIAEEARAKLEFRYKEILDSLPAAVYTCDTDGKVEMYNHAAALLWGRQPVIGTDLWCGSWKIFNPDDGTPLPFEQCPMAVTLKTGRPVYNKIIIVERPDGTRRTVAPHPRPLFDDKGNLAGAANMLIDLTDQRRAADVLRASEEKFRLICELVPTAIWMADDSGQVTYLNKRWPELTGKQPMESYGSKWVEFVHPGDRDGTQLRVMDAVKNKQSFTIKFRHLTKNGNYTTMVSTGTPYFDESGNLMGFIGIIQDIAQEEMARLDLEEKVSERTKQLAIKNEELRKSEERYHRMVDEVQDYAIIFLNADGIVENWNQGAEKIKGYQGHEIIGRHFRTFYPHQDQVEGRPEIFLQEAARNDRASHEGWRVRKDGSMFWGSVVLTALRDDNNELIGFTKVTRDLTERKLAHDALVEQNRKLERMNQELLTFAYVSSHDLQEPLRKIQIFSNRIMQIDGENLTDKSKAYFTIVQNSASRMRFLIEDVLAYSRTAAEEKKFVQTELNAIVDDVLQELNAQIEEKNARIDKCSLPVLKVIPFQFRQLIYNILSNSLKFCREDVTPHITMTHNLVTSGEVPFPADPVRYHQISIADNGIGFDPQHQARIFEVFQRLHTKTEFEGTGVGLAICKKIVENHGGAITAVGRMGVGATFHVFLPDTREYPEHVGQ